MSTLAALKPQLSKQDQIPGEVFASHDRIEVYVYKVEDNPRGVNVFVSRSHPEMIKRLMEQEIPEVYDGTVEIMSVAREAGDRTKLLFAVTIQTWMLSEQSLDAVEPTSRKSLANSTQLATMLRAIVWFQSKKNIDVIEWVADPAEFIYNAIAPAEVDQVIFDENDSKRALVVVPDNKLSLAIGRRGQKRALGGSLDWLPYRYQVCQ